MGPFALAGFDLGDQLLAVLAEAAEFVEFGVVARPDQIALREQHGRLGMNGFLEQLVYVGQLIQALENIREARRAQPREVLLGEG